MSKSGNDEEIADDYPTLDFSGFKQGAIAGNASAETKSVVAKWLWIFCRRGKSFAHQIGSRVRVTEVSCNKHEEQLQGKVVCETEVEQDMLNAGRFIHGACSMYLIDICSTLPISVLDLEKGGGGDGGVSQAIHTVFHAPAFLGDTLRIVSTSMTVGQRTMTCRCEIWSKTHNRLIASGTQVKMHMSKEAKAKL